MSQYCKSIYIVDLLYTGIINQVTGLKQFQWVKCLLISDYNAGYIVGDQTVNGAF